MECLPWGGKPRPIGVLQPLFSADLLTALQQSLAGSWLCMCMCMHGEEAGTCRPPGAWQLLAVTGGYWQLLARWCQGQGPAVTCQAGLCEATAWHAMPCPELAQVFICLMGSEEGVHACNLRGLPLSHRHWRLVVWSQLFSHGLLPLAVPHTVFRPPPCSRDHHTKRYKRYQQATWAFAFSAICLCPQTLVHLSICLLFRHRRRERAAAFCYALNRALKPQTIPVPL